MTPHQHMNSGPNKLDKEHQRGTNLGCKDKGFVPDVYPLSLKYVSEI